MEEETKKSYNPFKMWGSWIGLVVGLLLILGFFIPLLLISNPSSRLLDLTNWILFSNPLGLIVELFINCSGMAGIGCFFLIIFSTPIIFFLIGWGIHSLIRRLKSQKV